MNKTAKLLQFVNYRMKVTVSEDRHLVGTFLAFDRYMNLVLADCQEFRRVKKKSKATGGVTEEKEIMRTLGLVLLRGESVVSIQVESPPKKKAKTEAALPAGGRGVPVGRGAPMDYPPAGLPPPGMVPYPGGLQASGGLGRGPPPGGVGMGRGVGLPPPLPPHGWSGPPPNMPYPPR